MSLSRRFAASSRSSPGPEIHRRVHAPLRRARAPAVAPAARPLTGAQICGIVVFPLLGAGLALAGMPVADALTLLAGCGAIGAATIATDPGA
ncbi:hypothetical protein [Streptomyces chartreusis]|uniref:hypothetical protein n=1 Tax=Streptomyces chartreusis TaxID=1969 RepID=UPI0035DB0237